MKLGSVLAEKVKTGNSRGQVEFADAGSFANATLLAEKHDGSKLPLLLLVRSLYFSQSDSLPILLPAFFSIDSSTRFVISCAHLIIAPDIVPDILNLART